MTEQEDQPVLYSGKDLRLQIRTATDPDVWVSLAGERGCTVEVENEPCMVTDKADMAVAPVLPVTDPTLWVDASTLTSSPVASWTDLSGFNRHMVQFGTGTPSVQFADQNGLNVVQYTAASQQAHMSASDPLQHTSNESFTAFCVMKKTQSGAANGVLNGRGNAQYNGWGFTLQSNGFYVVISEAWAQYGSAFTDTSPSGSTVISAGRKSGTALRSRRVDSVGNDATYNATSASGTIRASASYNLQAGIDNNSAYVSEKLCEVLIYRRALSDSEFASVISYLNDKWITP